MSFCINYTTWKKHREDTQYSGPPTPTVDDEENLMEDVLRNFMGPNFDWEVKTIEDQPNIEAKRFFEILATSEDPLWKIDFIGESIISSGKHSILSTII
jgi:hypothetical protein